MSIGRARLGTGGVPIALCRGMSARHFACGIVLVAAIASAACGGGEALPTAPSPSQNIPVPELPTSGPPMGQMSLHGRVTEAPPTTITQVYPAIVTITDGDYAGRTGEVDPGGFYRIDGLRPGRFTVTVSADGFLSTSRVVDFGVEQIANFELMPVPETVRYVLTGDIAPGDGTCFDGEAERACRIVAFPVHNDGTLEARLDWTPSITSDLDLALFISRANQPIARSAIRGRDNDIIRMDIAGGLVYELRITYAAGSTPALYTLTLDTPN